MKMVKGIRGKRLSDVVVAARRQVDVLAVPGLFFVQSFLQEQLNRKGKSSPPASDHAWWVPLLCQPAPGSGRA